ncbi:glucosaminidase domain-containing protein [Adlercreutzia sp. ZJ154]|uniref:C40 family peptidase n=1 Tax=Adlercreutzia sp. ZJ154 TaxID=2709790 RepID=UPI0013EC8073|nr:glucosaminidase domain-containing protein [Adlercreutzia sp. ZJ154]
MVRNSDFSNVAIKVGRVGTAALLSVALAVPPIAITSSPALAVSESSDAVSAAEASKSLCDNQIRLGKVIVELRASGVAGAEAVERYLTGKGFTKADVLGMDVAAIAQVDANLSSEISWLKGVLTTPVAEEVPAPENPAENEADSSTDDNADNADSSDAADDASVEEETNSESQDAESGDAESTNDDSSKSESSSSDTASDNESSSNDASEKEETPSVPELVVPHPVFGGLASDAESDAPAYPQWSYNGDATYTPHNIGVNMTTEKFVAVIGEQARQIADESGLYASVMIAQAILESASGNSALATAPNNNLFGIKGAYNGSSVNMRTVEYDDSGMMYITDSDFRSYPTMRDSLTDYALLLTNSMGGFYSGAWKLNAETYVDACDFLQGRYATDIAYSAKLQDLIVTYDLTRYDEPLDYVLTHTYEVVDNDGQFYSSEANLETGELQMEQRDLVDLVVEATSHLGEDYVWGGTTPGSFDCSGLVQYAYRQAMGVEIPRTTHYQCMQGDDVDFNDLHMGDLLFFTYEDNTVGHVGMYLAEGCFIEAPQTGEVIKITSMSEKMPTFAKRIIESKPVDKELAQKSTSERWEKAVALIRTQQASDAADALPISIGGKRD